MHIICISPFVTLLSYESLLIMENIFKSGNIQLSINISFNAFEVKLLLSVNIYHCPTLYNLSSFMAISAIFRDKALSSTSMQECYVPRKLFNVLIALEPFLLLLLCSGAFIYKGISSKFKFLT